MNTTSSGSDMREHNIQLIYAFLDFLEQKDLNKWIDLWAEDGQQINPFAPKGFPRTISGKNALFHHWKGIPKSYGRMVFKHREVYSTLNPDVIFVEFQGEIEVLATGKNYNNKYCCRFTFLNGKVISYVEYFDPAILLESLGDTLYDTFSISKERNE